MARLSAAMSCNMMKGFIMTFTVSVVLVLPGGQSDIKTVTGKAEQSVTLHAGVTRLNGDFQIIWSYGSEQRLLLNFNDGKLEFSESQRFHLDNQTGALTIWPLSVRDSGLYQRRIINGNGSLHHFNLTVEEPDPVPPPAGPPQNITAGHRGHIAAGVLCVLFVLVCIMLLACAVRQKKTTGNCRGNGATV